MALPMFQRIGAAAFKKDLTNTIALCEHLGNPQHKFKSIHVGGTNGKGSSSHMLASVLQEAGYKTGLYTSPHLKDFTERIRINGESVSEQFVVDFVARIKPQIEFIKPSFFEITVVMAFEYFAQQKVDVAVIEVGMGGRLDSTNVIMPVLSLITNIGTDHQEFLGDTPQKIAFEKAGIIKKEVPVVISEYQAEVADVFMKKAQEKNAAIYFAANEITCVKDARGIFLVTDTVNQNSILTLDLAGNYQQKNLPGVLKSLRLLQDIGFQITAEQIQNGLAHVVRNTNLKGRWQQIGSNPLSICDTGHNLEGIQEVLQQIAQQHFETLHIVWGSVKDKDIAAILSLLPKDAKYYFCQAKIPRAMDAADLAKMAAKQGL
ncbi:MAG TPA: folylpolyglutamate synthase/dihydrofolate synthase family protein, partial [Cyclobacteriaceae bacterium]|nr:folylpolyglutamate synthase/dihydrofolate synthase family protein [Cyclobacteriaceae bacterium]